MDTNTGDFLCFCILCDVLPILLIDIGCACAYDGGDDDAGLRQMVQGQSTAEVGD